jgi:outer membrane protein assembly factor BamB
MTADDRAILDALDRFWDEVADGQTGVAVDLDPDDASAVRLFQRLPNSPAPRPGAADRVWDRIVGVSQLDEVTDRNTVPNPQTSLRRVVPLPPVPRIRFGAEQRRWVSAQLATAALLVLTLGSVFVAFGGRQLAGLLAPIGPTEPVASAAIVRGNPARTGVNPGPGPAGIPTIRWAAATADLSDVVVADGTAYASFYDGTIRAFDGASGRELWRYESGVLYKGYAAPLVAGGVVYVGLPDGNFYALDAAGGSVHWSYSIGTESCAAPALVGKVVYVAAGCGQPGGAVIALDAATGRVLWRVAVAGGQLTTPAVADGIVFLGAGGLSANEEANGFGPFELSTEVLALDAATGATRWRFETGGGINSAPAVADGTVYVGSESGLWALAAADGQPRWHFRTVTNDPVWAPPAVADGRVFVYVSDRYLYALNAKTGAEEWRFGTPDSQYSSLGPTVVGGVLYAGSVLGDIYVLDAASGTEHWDINTGRAIVAAPTVVNGVIYLAANGIVVLADPPPATPNAA